MKVLRRILIGLVIAFIVFFLVTRPHDAAVAVQNIAGALWGAGVAVTQFFSTLAGG